MKYVARCKSCDSDVPVDEQAIKEMAGRLPQPPPPVSAEGRFWLRIWTLIAVVLVVLILSVVVDDIVGSYYKKAETEAFLKDPSIKVEVSEMPTPSGTMKIRKFTR